jgi:hypothetical protein
MNSALMSFSVKFCMSQNLIKRYFVFRVHERIACPICNKSFFIEDCGKVQISGHSSNITQLYSQRNYVQNKFGL